MSTENQTGLTPSGSARSLAELWPDANSQTSPIIRERQLIYDSSFHKLHQLTADFGNQVKEYYVNEYGDRAGVVVVKQGQVLLVRQYRLLVDGLSWEIPGGAVHADETPVQAATRECIEETGVCCLNPQPLLFYHMALDGVYNPTHLFYAHTIVEAGNTQPGQPHEVEGYEWLPLKQCLEMIFSQQVVDSFTIIGLLSYQALIGLE